MSQPFVLTSLSTPNRDQLFITFTTCEVCHAKSNFCPLAKWQSYDPINKDKSSRPLPLADLV